MAENDGSIIDENVDILGGCGMVGCGVGAALFVLIGVLSLLTSLIIWPAMSGSEDGTEGAVPTAEHGEVVEHDDAHVEEETHVEEDAHAEEDTTHSEEAVEESGVVEDVAAAAPAVDLDSIAWAIPILSLNASAIDDPVNAIIRGNGSPDSVVNLFINGTGVGTTTVTADNQWAVGTRITQYRNEIVAVGARPDGVNIGQTQTELLYVAGAAAPLAFSDMPQVGTAGADGTTPITWSGTGEPNMVVDIYNGTEIVGRSNIDAAGSWAYSGNLNLPPGSYDFSAKMVDAGRDVTLDESASVNVVIPEDDAVAVTAEPFPTLLLSTIGGAAASDLVTITVQAESNETVALVVDGVEILTEAADENGQLTFAGYFAGGSHMAIAQGQQSVSEAIFSVGAPSRPALTSAGNGAFRLLSSSTDADVTGTVATQSPAVELIVDASWSMTFPLDSSQEADRLTAADPNSRIAIAKAALDSIIDDIPADSEVALRAFGNRATPLECQTTLETSLQPLDKAALQAVIAGIEPQYLANTAIGASLAQVGNDLAGTDRQKVVVLLTDGDETCNGNPSATVAQLQAQGIDLRLNIVGFALGENDALRDSFVQLAQQGNGQYYDAADADQLRSAFIQALTVSGYRIIDTNGNTVARGSADGNDLSLAPGVYTVATIGDGATTWENVVVTEQSVVELSD